MAFQLSKGAGVGGRGQQLAVDLVYTSAGGVVGGSSCALQALRWRMRCAAMPRAGRALVFEVAFPVSLLILPESTQAQI